MPRGHLIDNFGSQSTLTSTEWENSMIDSSDDRYNSRSSVFLQYIKCDSLKDINFLFSAQDTAPSLNQPLLREKNENRKDEKSDAPDLSQTL